MDTDDEAWLYYKNKFSDVYDESNYNSPLQAYAMNAGHRLLERAFPEQMHFDRVLEIGAGTGEHFRFVRHTFDEYILADNNEAALDVAKKKISSTMRSGIEFQTQHGEALSYPDNAFDRLIAAHVLEHIYKPHLALKEWMRVIKNGGTLSILIPTDPGIAWRLGRRLGPRRNAISQGISYDYVMAREHVNPCNNLIAILRHYFPESKQHWWPFPVSSIDLNLFYVFHGIINK